MPIRYALMVGALLTLEQAQALVLARAHVLASEAVCPAGLWDAKLGSPANSMFRDTVEVPVPHA